MPGFPRHHLFVFFFEPLCARMAGSLVCRSSRRLFARSRHSLTAQPSRQLRSPDSTAACLSATVLTTFSHGPRSCIRWASSCLTLGREGADAVCHFVLIPNEVDAQFEVLRQFLDHRRPIRPK